MVFGPEQILTVHYPNSQNSTANCVAWMPSLKYSKMKLHFSLSTLLICIFVFAAIAGCGGHTNDMIAHVRVQLDTLATISDALFQQGYDLSTISTVSELLKIAIETKEITGHSELAKDSWGNPYNWNVITVEDGFTIFISSVGEPDNQKPHKEPFVRIQLHKNREPKTQFYDCEVK